MQTGDGNSQPGSRSRALIERYDNGGAVLAYAVSGLTVEQEQAHPGPEAWSIAEIAAHLLDSDLVYTDRMKRVIAEDEPALLAFDQDRWIERLGSNRMAATESAELLKLNRRWMVQVLGALDDDAFARSGTHSEIGRVTLASLLATITNHVDHHLRFVYAKRARLGVALPPRYVSEGL